MRPIDADALDKAAAELPIRLPFDKKKFLHLIATTPTVDAVGQWTIVSEELPPPGEHVLCWYEYFRYGDYNAMYQTFGIGYQYNGCWGGEVSNGHKAKVLAWMPLPQPPQGEQRCQMNDHAAECLEIKQVCDKYGCGDVMEWASALWRYEHRREGLPTTACYVPTCPSFIKEGAKFSRQQMLYDSFVDEILGAPKGGIDR